ncbi:MAG: GNAT family N-acetyltransferase [Acidobacteria bacterium]|nr:GNAT family N-acetyltransferase [Acidobacteriota bacterium]
MIHQLSNEYYVRGLRVADLHGPYTTWFEDQDVCRYNSHGKFAKTEEYFKVFFDHLNQEDRLVWAICHHADGHIGNVSLQSISVIDHNAEFAILLGDKRHWGKGVGTLAGRKLVEHGFNKLNLERLYCGTAATNHAMRTLAANLGMTEEGTRRKHLYLEGEWVDVIEYGLLKDEFLALSTVWLNTSSYTCTATQ